MLIHSWAADYESLEMEDVPISADTSVALPELTRLCRQLSGKAREAEVIKSQRFNASKEIHTGLRQKWLAAAKAAANRQDIAPSFLAWELWETIKNEDWVLVNGTADGWARRIWEFSSPYQYLGWSNGGAGLGYGMGAAIGATLAQAGTGRICVNMQTDGDLLMTPSALWTAAHHRLPLLIVMFNNQSYYNSEQHQTELAKIRQRPVERAGIGTHLDSPPINFAKMAESFGIYNEGPLQKPETLRPALERALKMVKENNVPALVDVVTEGR
jgi:thiamine pyrophosphate-dependent acetolactate synthase large subunit-like protein